MTATTTGPTAGPWRVEPRSLYETNVVAGNAVVATIHGTGLEQELADARLIAAAPDLLASARLLIENCWRCNGSGNYEFDQDGKCAMCYDARLGVAKAEGRES